MRLNVEESIARARTLSGGSHRVILGITGPPGAGKSTTARSLVSQVPGSVLLGMDAFHLAQSSLERLGLVERKGAPHTFDPAGYVALLRRIRQGEAGVIWAPEFRREVEDSVSGAVAIPPETTLIVTEGNYLLLDEGPWAALHSLLDEIWYVEVPESVRWDRLTHRHEEFGRSPAQARERTLGSDEDNARMVLNTRGLADALIVPTTILRPEVSSPQAVFVGLTTLDVIQRVIAEPSWGHKGLCESSELVAGGPAANAAVTFASLTGSATLVTAVGVGSGADAARQDLERHGVHVVDCAPDGWDLPIATCIIAANGERTVISPGATKSEARLNQQAREAVSGAEALLIDGHHPLLAREALSLTRGLKVLDAGSAKTHVEPWLGEFDVVVCSADYAPEPQRHGVRVTRHVLAAGAGAVVVTHGSGPVQWQRNGGPEYSVDPPQVKTKDTLGAGDAFHGAFVAGLLQEPPGLESLARAVRLATVTASLRCSVVGARSWLEQLPKT